MREILEKILKAAAIAYETGITKKGKPYGEAQHQVAYPILLRVANKYGINDADELFNASRADYLMDTIEEELNKYGGVAGLADDHIKLRRLYRLYKSDDIAKFLDYWNNNFPQESRVLENGLRFAKSEDDFINSLQKLWQREAIFRKHRGLKDYINSDEEIAIDTDKIPIEN